LASIKVPANMAAVLEYRKNWLFKTRVLKSAGPNARSSKPPPQHENVVNIAGIIPKKPILWYLQLIRSLLLSKNKDMLMPNKEDITTRNINASYVTEPATYSVGTNDIPLSVTVNEGAIIRIIPGKPFGK
jgi:hypothetical protein